MAAALAAGLALTPGTISVDAGRVLVIFFGLVAASILPTITLLINSMTASGRSVQSLRRLEVEIQAAMDALFLLFGVVGIAVAALVAMSIQPAAILDSVPYLTSQILPRIEQGIIVLATTLLLWRIGQIPGLLRRTLSVRYDGALEEAREKLNAKAPDGAAIRKVFATHPEFGQTVALPDQQRQETH